MSRRSTCTSYIHLHTEDSFLNATLMTPMNKPELPPESVHWTSFNESDALAIIMQAQNYINGELIRKGGGRM